MPLADWTKLEAQGLLPKSPGREEAVKAALEATAEKQRLADEARKAKARTRKAKARTRKRK